MAWKGDVLKFLSFLLGLAAFALSACSPAYVARAAYEEARILWRRESIEEVLRRGRLDSERQEKLEMVLEARNFAERRIGLRVGESYATISEVNGGEIVHLLSAARRNRLESCTWWFPIVGRIPYKGFFSRDEALGAAKSLEQQGYDTYVRPAIAFSTLGWFDDPLLSSLLARSRVTLANVVFHELFHNTLFVPGEMDFNESAANFAGGRAAIEFFCAGPKPGPEECREARAEWRDTLAMSRFLASSLADLEGFYATLPSGPALEAVRERIFASIRDRFRELRLETGQWSGFASAPLNNASLLHNRTYLRDLELFEDLYRQRGSLARAVADLHETVGKGGDPFDRLRGIVEGAPAPRIAGKGPLR